MQKDETKLRLSWKVMDNLWSALSRPRREMEVEWKLSEIERINYKRNWISINKPPEKKEAAQRTNDAKITNCFWHIRLPRYYGHWIFMLAVGHWPFICDCLCRCVCVCVCVCVWRFQFTCDCIYCILRWDNRLLGRVVDFETLVKSHPKNIQ